MVGNGPRPPEKDPTPATTLDSIMLILVLFSIVFTVGAYILWELLK